MWYSGGVAEDGRNLRGRKNGRKFRRVVEVPFAVLNVRMRETPLVVGIVEGSMRRESLRLCPRLLCYRERHGPASGWQRRTSKSGSLLARKNFFEKVVQIV